MTNERDFGVIEGEVRLLRTGRVVFYGVKASMSGFALIDLEDWRGYSLTLGERRCRVIGRKAGGIFVIYALPLQSAMSTNVNGLFTLLKEREKQGDFD